MVPRQVTRPLIAHLPTSTDMLAHSIPEIDFSERPGHVVTNTTHHTATDSSHPDDGNLPINTLFTRSIAQTHSRFPKLTLPNFNGNLLQWQTFWDSFTAAVDSNADLSLVQKFGYLRAQLLGDAANAISGLPLTDANYIHSVTLLKDAHMEALLNIRAPSNTLTSLQSFYDTVKRHMRSLPTLRKTPDLYGTLLSSVILGKLSSDTKTRMAQDHYDTEWTVEDLMASILKEIRIFEAGQHTSRRPISMSTTSTFYMGANRGGTQEKHKKDPKCVFCKGTHKPNLCTTVTCPKVCLAVVKNAGLCFNCLGRHKVFQCPSKFTCRECHNNIIPASAMPSLLNLPQDHNPLQWSLLLQIKQLHPQ